MNHSALEETFTQLVKQGEAFDVTISEQLVARCLDFAKLLLTANESRNLTRLTSPENMTIGMFLDSLLFMRIIKGKEDVVDIGCGAGFPSVPLALAFPKLHITAVDSRKMKVDFIAECCEELGLNCLKAKHARVEDLPPSSCDLVVARAVGSLPKTLQLGLPLLRPGGRLTVARSATDLQEAFKKSKKLLSKCQVDTWTYRLPGYRKDFAHVTVTKGE